MGKAMSYCLKEDARAVLLPAFGTTQLSEAVKRFLSNGGCSIIPGETRGEYVAREVTRQRRHEETAEILLALTREARALAGNVLVAVDQEISGICRLHALVPPFPPKERVGKLSSHEFETISADIALAARKLGISCFLGPILDIVTGDNPWLSGRTWSTDPVEIAKISSAYIRGLQANGIAATAKHFPRIDSRTLQRKFELWQQNMAHKRLN
jgi:beta-N-acetylhexosaminidase